MIESSARFKSECLRFNFFQTPLLIAMVINAISAFTKITCFPVVVSRMATARENRSVSTPFTMLKYIPYPIIPTPSLNAVMSALPTPTSYIFRNHF